VDCARPARALKTRDEARRRVEELRTHSALVDAALEAGDLDRRRAGSLLAGGIAFRIFLWLLPAALFAAALVRVGTALDVVFLLEPTLGFLEPVGPRFWDRAGLLGVDSVGLFEDLARDLLVGARSRESQAQPTPTGHHGSVVWKARLIEDLLSIRG